MMIQLNQRDSIKLYTSNSINKKSDDESDKIDNQILQIDQQCLNPRTRQNYLIKIDIYNFVLSFIFLVL